MDNGLQVLIEMSEWIWNFDPSADDGSGVGGDQSDRGQIAGTEAAFLGGVDSRWAALGDFAVGGRCTGGEGSGGEEIGGTSD
ncbi:MAG: hypothetical protein DMG57_36685 [Acidobacteria bacterium]|nr:MAG: hypothetical protein DMG57_36685 [Acidobacteriota bacterium]